MRAIRDAVRVPLLLALVLIVVAVLGLAAVALAGRTDRPSPLVGALSPRGDGAGVGASSPGARATMSAAGTGGVSVRTLAPSVRLGPLADHRLLVVGASYTEGLGAVPVTNGYAYLLGRQLGWPTTVGGASGTGFLNPGPRHQGTFGQRVERLPRALDPGLVIVQCGRNDIGYDPARLRKAITATVAGIRTRFPQAQLVLLGSIPGGAPTSSAVHGVDALLGAQARQLSVPFIDPVAEQWITTSDARGFAGTVAQHPNNAGYAFIARRVLADLATLSGGQITSAIGG